MQTKLDDSKLEALIEEIMDLTCEYALADIVDAIAFHARATSESADTEVQRAAWLKAADALEGTIAPVMAAEEVSP